MPNQHTDHTLKGLYPSCQASDIKKKWIKTGRIVITDKCWIWQGSKNNDGYGTIGVHGKTLLVHRVVFFICYGEEPEEVCHNCPVGDNPSCCNPKHLFSGSHLENMRDAVRKGRIKPRDSRGSKNPGAILSESVVIEIRKKAIRLPKKKGLYTELGREFGVSGSTISRILNRKIWKHI